MNVTRPSPDGYQFHPQPLLPKHSALPIPSFPEVKNWPTREFRASRVNTGYREVTENLVDKTLGDNAWDALDAKLDALPDCDVKMQELTQAMKQHDWNHPIFQDDTLFAYYGLAALKEGRMSKTQFATLMSYWAVRQHNDPKDIEVVELFNADGATNAKALEILLKTAKSYPHSKLQPEDFSTSAEIKKFLAEMQQLPRSEQQFFVVRDAKTTFMSEIERLEAIKKNKITIVDEIHLSSGFNLFCRFEEGTQGKRMIPSVGMMQTILKVHAPQTAVTITPVIGLGTLEDIEENGLDHTRVLSIPFPGAKYPTEADLLPAPKAYDFIWHDFFHCFFASLVPEEHQKTIITIAREIKSMLPLAQTKEERIIIQELYERFADMEAVMYTPARSMQLKDNKEAFLVYLSMQPGAAMYRLALKGATVQEALNNLNKLDAIFTPLQIRENIFAQIGKRLGPQIKKIAPPTLIERYNDKAKQLLKNKVGGEGRAYDLGLLGVFTVQMEKGMKAVKTA